jgi:hypothetical protein
MQALLPTLLIFAFSAGAFLLGMHNVHTGAPVTLMAGKSDAFDCFLWSAVAFVLGADLLAVAMGWIKSPKPEGSGTQPRK